jgi:DNA-binding HxlR family transcriptional regulator
MKLRKGTRAASGQADQIRTGNGANDSAIAEALALMELRWNPQILGEVFTGVHRFNQIQENLGISRPILSRRLKLLVNRGVLKRCRYAGQPTRIEYVPTAKGRELIGTWLRDCSSASIDSTSRSLQGDSANGNGSGSVGAANALGWFRRRPRALNANDPAAREAFDLMGVRWNLLILGQVFSGVHRFNEIEENLGISSPVLSRRLKLLVEEGILERRRYAVQPARFEYRPTPKGNELYPALSALVDWASATGNGLRSSDSESSPAKRLGPSSPDRSLAGQLARSG